MHVEMTKSPGVKDKMKREITHQYWTVLIWCARVHPVHSCFINCSRAITHSTGEFQPQANVKGKHINACVVDFTQHKFENT